MSIKDRSDMPSDASEDEGMGDINVEDMVRAYRNIRDAKQEFRSEADARMGDFDEKLDKLEKALLDVCSTQGAESINTKAGTVIRQVEEKFWASDWEAFDKFLLQKAKPDFLQRRIAAKNMREWLADNPDADVPGLKVDRKYVIRVRKPATNKD
jgi:hypothetical protein